jgi:putative membrane protein
MMLRSKTGPLAALVASLVLTVAGCGDDAGGQTIFLISDAEIMQVLHSVNAGEIQQGELAQMKATSQAVKDLAGRIVTAHQMAETRQKNMEMTYGITPQPTQTSKDVEAKAAAAADFDRAYVDTQVTMHTDALTVIDTKLIPHARISSVKAEVPKARAEVEDHLTDAKMVQSQLPSM